MHLVADSRVELLLSQIKTRYYESSIRHYPEAAERYEKNPLSALLALRPAGGAGVLF